MKEKRPLYVANWKMAMPPEKARSFVEKNKADLKLMAMNADIVICPSYIAIPMVASEIQQCGMFVGAQNCSEYESGSYTGEMDIASLKDVGCTHVIVGHSERRIHFRETDTIIAQKIEALTAQHMVPILCIGETEQENKAGSIHHVIEKQLALPLQTLRKKPAPFCIAYEPVWAIGTNTMPSTGQIDSIAAFIEQLAGTAGLLKHARILYGGSVTPENAQEIMMLETINGLLIGSASLDFQKFKNIVL